MCDELGLVDVSLAFTQIGRPAARRPLPDTKQAFDRWAALVVLPWKGQVHGVLGEEHRDHVSLLGGVAAEKGHMVTMFLTKDAVHLALPGHATGVACEGCPPIERLFDQYQEAGGELLVCPICVKARDIDETQFVAHARVGGATPLWDLDRRRRNGLQLLGAPRGPMSW